MTQKRRDDAKDELDLKPVDEKIAGQISQRFEQLAIGVQTLFNGLQRQAMTNLGTINFYSNSANRAKNPKVNLSSLTDGLSSRLLYQGVATYPSLIIRSYLTNETDLPKLTISLASCGTETFLGVLPEVNSSRKTFAKLGIDISRQDLLPAASRVFFPYLCRNALAWAAINSNSNDNIPSKLAHGALAGFSSSFFHNIGNKVIENTPGKTWQETAEIVMQEVKQKPLSFFNGASFRAASIAATALFLAPEATKRIENACNEIAQYFFEGLNPSTSPKPEKIGKMVTETKERKQ